MAVLIYFRHAPNIRRLLNGEEPKIGAGKKAKDV
jgi:glycerol-3-phosphate acyltransferase PlsY